MGHPISSQLACGRLALSLLEDVLENTERHPRAHDQQDEESVSSEYLVIAARF